MFGIFGGFWFTFGSTITPGFGAYGLYSTTGVVADGLKEPQFYATFSFFLISMTILCAIFAVASIRTNVVLLTILVILVPTCMFSLPYLPRLKLTIFSTQSLASLPHSSLSLKVMRTRQSHTSTPVLHSSSSCLFLDGTSSCRTFSNRSTFLSACLWEICRLWFLA